LFPIFEAEHGEVTNSRKIRNRVPVSEYLRPQKRFAHLFPDGEADGRIARLQQLADRNIAEFHLAADDGGL
jgi:pyruvate ferredoxin oxidoreductase beta subunit